MLNWKWCLLIVSSAYLIFILAKLPVQLVLPQLNQLLPKRTVVLSEPRGTIWEGSIDIGISQLGGIGTLSLSWKTKPLGLLLGHLSFDYRLIGVDLKATGDAALKPGGWELVLERGRIGPIWLNKMLKQQGVKIQTPISMTDLLWSFDTADKATLEAQGRLNWPGGLVEVPVGEHEVPALTGRLTAQSGALYLEVVDKARQRQIMTGELMPTGWMKLTVLKRVLTLVGAAATVNKPEKVLFKIQQKMF